MKKSPLVSVNLTTYNRRDLLARCLDSILLQTYDNYEIIIIDDFSKDGTEKIVERYRKEYPQIKYFKHLENKGNAFARNTAFKHCKGKYVAFMDDDDEWIDADKLKKQVEIFETKDNQKIGIICGNVKVVDQLGKIKTKFIKKPRNLPKKIMEGNGVIFNSTVLTKRNIMQKVGGFDEKQPRGVDSAFFRSCIIKHNYDVVFMNDVLALYHEDNNDRMTPQKTIKANLKAVKAELYILKSYNILFLRYPSALYIRFKKIVIALVLICLNVIGIKR